MAQYTIGDKAAKQIAQLIRGQAGNPGQPGTPPKRNQGFQELFISGKVDATLSRNGTATLSVYKPNTSGGIGTDTGVNITVIDNGKAPTNGISTTHTVDACYSRGAWIVIGYGPC